jgi:hypothetical protein
VLVVVLQALVQVLVLVQVPVLVMDFQHNILLHHSILRM